MPDPATLNFSLKRLSRKIIFFFARRFPFIPGKLRAYLHKLAVVNILKPFKTFIGSNELFDDLFPEDILVVEDTINTEGTRILAHFVDGSWDDFDQMCRGKVSI